jgi:signal transduction histidine kinase
MSLRTRFTLWNVAVLALALVLAGTLLHWRVQERLEAGLDRELESRAKRIPPHPPDEWSMFIPPAPVADELPIYTPQGIQVFGKKFAPDITSLRKVTITREPNFSTVQDMRIYTVPILDSSGKKVQMVFQTSESLVPLREEIKKLTRELIALIPASLLIAGLGGLLLTNRTLRPIQTITDATAEIQATDLSRRLPISGRDEFARLCQTLNEMFARLEDAFERQSRFVADASHELKSPLTIIKGAAGLGKNDKDATERSRLLFTRIDDATDRTTRLVQSLLLLARTDAGALPLLVEPIRLSELCAEAQDEARQLHPNSASIFRETGDITLCGDRQLLRQLLFNLLDNALRYTPPDNKVTIRAEYQNNGVQITVQDTGCGIAPEHLPRLTERFYRADTGRSRKEGGTGLGLSICKSIVALHRGTLHMESSVGQGTTVTLWLPHNTNP